MLDEDEFLSSHLTLIRTPADYSFSTQDAEKKVFEMFCNRASQYRLSYTRDQSESSKKEEVVSFDKIKKYAIDLANYVPYWFTVNCPDIKNTVELELYKIQCLNGSKEMRLFLAQLLALQKDEPVEFNRCLKNVEKILFRNRLPIPSIMDERSFATRARDLHIGDIKLEELNNELEAILAQTIEGSSLIGGFKWLFTYVRGNVGYHRWNGLKYFLFEFEEHIHQQDYSRDFAIISWDKFFETSIEHIMPKTYQDYWSDTMQDDVYVLVQDGWSTGKVLRELEVKKGKKLRETPDLVIGKTLQLLETRRTQVLVIIRGKLKSRRMLMEVLANVKSVAKLNGILGRPNQSLIEVNYS